MRVNADHVQAALESRQKSKMCVFVGPDACDAWERYLLCVSRVYCCAAHMLCIWLLYTSCIYCSCTCIPRLHRLESFADRRAQAAYKSCDAHNSNPLLFCTQAQSTVAQARHNVVWSRKRKEKITLFSDHNGSLLRRQPRAMTIGHSPKGKGKS